MAMTLEKAQEIANNVQEAHRICGAFYQRLFPTIDNIASELNCSFKQWDPLYRSRPCRSGTNPSSKWFWDLLPMIAARIVYSSGESDQTDVGDFIFEATVIIDDAITPEFRKVKKTTGTTDPIELPPADAYLKFSIYRATEHMRQDIIDTWNKCKEPMMNSENFEVVGEGIVAKGFRVSLANFIEDEMPIISELKECAGLA